LDQQKKNKIKSLLQQSSSECGKDKEFQEIKNAIEEIISAIDGEQSKNNQLTRMADSCKKNQEKWWSIVKSGMKSIKKGKK